MFMSSSLLFESMTEIAVRIELWSQNSEDKVARKLLFDLSRKSYPSDDAHVAIEPIVAYA